MTGGKEDKKFTKVSIPETLAKKVEKKIEGTNFDSLSSYVTYLLNEVISDMKEDDNEEFTEEDEEKVKQRLRGLGYLD